MLCYRQYYNYQHSNGGCLNIFLSSEFVRMIYRISYLPHQGMQKLGPPLNNRFIITTGIKIELLKTQNLWLQQTKIFDKKISKSLLINFNGENICFIISSDGHISVWRYLATLFSTPIDIPKLVKTFRRGENFRKIFDRFVPHHKMYN